MYTFDSTMHRMGHGIFKASSGQLSQYEELFYSCTNKQQSLFNGTGKREAITEEHHFATARELEKPYAALDALKWSAWIGLVNANY